MNESFLKSSEPTRRDFVLGMAKTCLGVTLMDALAPRASAVPFEGASKARQFATAKNVIYLYMSGGMSHLDTWDEGRRGYLGPTKTIKTSADGVRISEYLPRVAQQAHHMRCINSLTSTQGAHAQGNYFMHTAYTLRGTIRHPAMGAWLKVPGQGNRAVPNYVYMGGDSKHPGGGFFAARYNRSSEQSREGLRTAIARRASRSDNFHSPLGLSANTRCRTSSQHFPVKNVKNYTDMYHDAVAS